MGASYNLACKDLLEKPFLCRERQADVECAEEQLGYGNGDKRETSL